MNNDKDNNFKKILENIKLLLQKNNIGDFNNDTEYEDNVNIDTETKKMLKDY